MNQTKFWIKKTVILLLASLALYQLIMLARQGYDLIGFEKPYSIEMLLSYRVEPLELAEESLKEGISQLEDHWQQKVQVVYLSKAEGTPPKELGIVELSGKKVALFYDESSLDGKPYRMINEVRFSPSMLDAIAPFLYRIGEKQWVEYMSKIYAFPMIHSAFNDEEYQKLKNKYPRLAYSYGETAMLLQMADVRMMIDAIGWIGAEIGGVTRYTKEIDRLIKSEMTHTSLAGFYQGFTTRQSLVCWFEFAKQKMALLGLTMLATLLLNHLMRVDLDTMLDQELYRRGISMSFRKKMWLIAANWKLLLFSASKAKMVAVAQAACDRHEEKLKKRRIRQTAENLWFQIEQLGDETGKDIKYLIPFKEIAIGKGDKSASSREGALLQLFSGFAFVKRTDQGTIPSSRVTDVGKGIKKQRQYETSNRQAALDRLVGICPEVLELNVLSWSQSELDNLSLAVIQLKRIDVELIDRLLGRKDLKSLLKNKHIFMAAVRTGDERIIRDELRMDVSSAGGSPGPAEAPEETVQLAEDLRVVIIAAGKAVDKKDFLVQAVRDIGPKKVDFIQAHRLQQVRALTAGEQMVIVIKSRISHKVTDILGSKGIRYVEVHSINPERFMQEVIEKM